MKRIEVHFAGRVQGVGFRMTVQNLARGYDVNGTVRNLPDGRVELIADGAEAELHDFLKGIDESDLAGFIHERAVSWKKSDGSLRGFRILR